MEEINLKELFTYFKARILIMLIIILSVVLLGSIYSLFLKVPVYESTSSIVLVNDEGEASTNSASYNQSDATLNKSLIATYSEIVKTNRVMEKVIKNLSLDYSITELKNEIKVTNSTNTEIIKIQVIDKDKGLAAEIANEVVKVFSEEIKDIYKLQNVSVVDVATEASTPYNINFIKEIVIYFLIGAVVACALVFVTFYFDTTIKSTEEIENTLGLPVFGVVPEVKKKHREHK